MKHVTVVMTAGWGDGSITSFHGVASDEELESLIQLETELPEILEIFLDSETDGPIIEHVKWLICGGDEDLIDRLVGLPMDEFAKVVRRETAPVNYQRNEDEEDE